MGREEEGVLECGHLGGGRNYNYTRYILGKTKVWLNRRMVWSRE